MNQDTPFPAPKITCLCGREDEHTYCERWLERIHRFFTRRR